jgi:type II secretory pathway component PulK
MKSIIRHRKRSEGIVLIALLWILVALSLLALNLASTTRAETSVAQAFGEAERCYFHARGALETVLYQLSFSKRDAETQTLLFSYGGGMNHVSVNSDEIACHVIIQDEAGKLNLNLAPEGNIERLLTLLRAAEEQKSAVMDVIERRRKSSSEGGVSQPPRPFKSVEELLQVEGVSRELIYGTYRREPDGRVVNQRGLVDFLTVHPGTRSVNVTSAEPEVLAALPGMDLGSARSVVANRQGSPFTSADLAQRTAGTIPSSAGSQLTANSSGFYCLVSTAWVRGSKVRRSLKVVVKLNSGSKFGHQRLAWYDEYWPSQEILKWIDFNMDKGLEPQSARAFRLPFRETS